jgi:predicted permease
MDFHLLQRARDLEALGLSPEDARQEALRRFGDRARIQARLERIERSRGRRITLGYLTEELVQDVRYGVRTLLKRPGFTLTTATSLALGIAAITIVLSLVDSWLLRPLPVRHARELVVIGASSQALGPIPTALISQPTFRDIAGRTDLFQDAAAVRPAVVAVRRPESDQGQRRLVLAASGSYFSVLGVDAFRGRLFTAEDDRVRGRVVVLTHGAWHGAFGGDPAAIGATAYFNTVPFTIIGVTPPGFTGTEHFLDAFGFVPAGVLATLEPSLAGIDERREAGSFKVIARRQPDATIGVIQAGLDVLSRQLTSTFPDLEEGFQLRAFPESRARPSLEAGVGTVSGAIIFSALALLVLVTAAVNATNLVLVRGSARESELAVRQALGASRGRVVRQLVTETMLLAFAALAGGWFLARSAVGALTSIPITAADLPMQWNVAVDWRVFGLAVVITIVVGLVAGVGPALAVSRFDLQHRLREGGRGGLGRRGQRIRSTLVVLQVSASMVVLMIVALLGASVRNAASIDLGFQPDHLITFGLDAHLAHYDEKTARRAFERIERRMQEQPGVVATAWANSVALSPGAMVAGGVEVEAEGTTQTTERGTLSMFYSGVSPSWFEVVRMPVLEGRAFLATDDSLGKPVAIVNQQAAKVLWPGRPAVGQIIRLARGGPAVEVVGVVKTSRYLLIGEAPRPFLYVPFAQQPARTGYLYTRTEQDPLYLLPAIPALMAGVDRDLVPFGMNTMERLIDQSLNGMLLLRLGAGMASALGALALILTCVGLYGVVAYSVAQRSREIGLRLALGANRWDVIRSVVARGGMLAFIGIGVGTVLALLVTRPLSGLLVGVRVTDPVIFTGVATALALVTLASAWIPARRAARIDPVRALKEDGLGG